MTPPLPSGTRLNDHEADRRLRRLGPLVLIQEGAYDLPSLGDFAVAALRRATG